MDWEKGDAVEAAIHHGDLAMLVALDDASLALTPQLVAQVAANVLMAHNVGLLRRKRRACLDYLLVGRHRRFPIACETRWPLAVLKVSASFAPQLCDDSIARGLLTAWSTGTSRPMECGGAPRDVLAPTSRAISPDLVPVRRVWRVMVSRGLARSSAVLLAVFFKVRRRREAVRAIERWWIPHMLSPERMFASGTVLAAARVRFEAPRVP